MSSNAVEIERKLATGEMLLNRANRARIAGWIILVVFSIGLSILIHWISGALVVLAIGFTLRRITKGITELEEGMIKYRAMKAGLSGEDDA
jgi:hypothetical protein